MIPETPVDAGPLGRDEVRRRLSGQSSAEDVPIAASPMHVLRFLAAVLRARTAVEVGTGSGESALWLLSGMVPDGVLTSIDVDPTAQRRARAALADAGVPAGRTRLIAGVATEVLPRLTEGGYDLVSVSTATTEHARYLQLGVRLLRQGGVIVFAGVRATPAHRDLFRAVEEDEGLVPIGLPVGPGLLAVAKTA